jgi:hypothetical protein
VAVLSGSERMEKESSQKLVIIACWLGADKKGARHPCRRPSRFA